MLRRHCCPKMASPVRRLDGWAARSAVRQGAHPPPSGMAAKKLAALISQMEQTRGYYGIPGQGHSGNGHRQQGMRGSPFGGTNSI